jgi:hypothetical protein
MGGVQLRSNNQLKRCTIITSPQAQRVGQNTPSTSTENDGESAKLWPANCQNTTCLTHGVHRKVLSMQEGRKQLI